MVMDGPVIDYGAGKTKKKGSMIASRAEVDEMEELTSLWEGKRQGRSYKGEKISLNDFVKGESVDNSIQK